MSPDNDETTPTPTPRTHFNGSKQQRTHRKPKSKHSLKGVPVTQPTQLTPINLPPTTDKLKVIYFHDRKSADKYGEFVKIVRSKDSLIITINQKDPAFSYLWLQDQVNPLDLQIDYETQVSCDAVVSGFSGKVRKMRGPRFKPGAQHEEAVNYEVGGR